LKRGHGGRPLQLLGTHHAGGGVQHDGVWRKGPRP
jgi:hypothetical protein